MWSAFDQSGFALAIQSSTWAYPALLAAHGLGMAVVVGLTMVVALRILGFPKGAPLGGYLGTLPYLVAAFLVNAASGLALFVADATTLAANPSFQIKLIAITLGLLAVWRMYATAVGPAARLDTASPTGDATGFIPSRSAKAMAVLSLLIWSLSVIVSGRLVAYLSKV